MLWKCKFVIDDTQYGFVYIITNNLTGVRYVGRKKFGFGDKWKQYTSSSKYLNAAIDFYGITSFSFDIISLHHDVCSLAGAEIKLQESLNVLKATLPNGERAFYNRNINGTKFYTPKGIKKPNTSNALRGKPKSPEHCANIKKAKLNQTPETRMKISVSQKGKPRPWLIGHEVSVETREKIGDSHRGKIISNNHKEAISKHNTISKWFHDPITLKSTKAIICPEGFVPGRQPESKHREYEKRRKPRKQLHKDFAKH